MPKGKPYEPKDPDKVLAAYAQHKTLVATAKALGGVCTKTLGDWLRKQGVAVPPADPTPSNKPAKASNKPAKASNKPAKASGRTKAKARRVATLSLVKALNNAKSMEEFYRWVCTGFAHGYIPLLVEKLKKGEF
jgi:hypothetical protein